MAMCLLKLGRFHDAKKYCQQADNLLPGDGKVLYRWAKSLYELGKGILLLSSLDLIVDFKATGKKLEKRPN